MKPVEFNGSGGGHSKLLSYLGLLRAVPILLCLIVLAQLSPARGQTPAPPAPLPAAAGGPPTTTQAVQVIPRPVQVSTVDVALSNPLFSVAPKTVGTTPVVSAESKTKQAKYLSRLMDPELTLDLVVGQTRVMVLKNTPFRVQSGEERIMTLSVINTKELILQGKEVGSTVMNIWFGDKEDPAKQETLTYLVRVYPDPEAKERLEKAYKQLEDDINKHFKDTSVRLKLLGDKLVISGRVRDAQQGTQVMQIIRANFQNQGNQRSGSNSTNNLAALGGGQAAQIPLTPLGGEVDPLTGLSSPSTESYLSTAGNNIINLLEVAGEQQVALRVIVAEVSRAAARTIGLNFSVRNNQGVTVFQNNVGNSGGGIAGAAATLTAAIDGSKIPLAINAMRTLSYAKSLAEPTLVTLNGQTANFLAGGQFPVPVITGFGGSNGLQGVNFVPFGVQLSFTPFITDRDRIRLQLNANISTRDVSSGANIGGANVSGLNSRTVNTVVELRQGETLAVAGLIESNHGADASRVPLLGDLPFLTPFTKNNITAGEKELVIFITPELVRPLEVGEVPPTLGADIIEPTDVEFYLLNRLEGRVGPYRSVVRTDWGRIRQFEKVERAMLSGPSGYCPAP